MSTNPISRKPIGGEGVSRGGFWRGIVMGGLAGAMLGVYLYPQLKPETRHRIAEKGREISSRAQHYWNRTRRRARRFADQMG